MDIDYVKQMCCNLQQQQQKINEVYDELMNSLNLQDKVDELNRKLDKKEEELMAKHNLIKDYENKLNLKENEVENYNNLINNKERELKEAKRQLEESLEDLERVKSAGNMIISTHNQQFVKLLDNMEKLSDFIEYYTAEEPKNHQEGLNNSDSDATNKSGHPKCTMDQKATNKSSLELLVDINNKFVKISVNIMKLLSQFDHDILNNYINCDDLASNIELIGKLGSGREWTSGFSEPNYGSNSRTSSLEGSNYMGSAHSVPKLSNNCNNYANFDGFQSNYKFPPTPSNNEWQPNSSNQTPNRATPAKWEYSIIPTYPFINTTVNNAHKILNSQTDNPTLHHTSNSNVKRIVTRFRPNFNASFQQIPLYSSTNGLNGYSAVFKPLYSSNSKNRSAHTNSRSNTNSMDNTYFRNATSYSDGTFGRNDSILSKDKSSYGVSTIDSDVFVDLPKMAQEAPQTEENDKEVESKSELDQENAEKSKQDDPERDNNAFETPLKLEKLWEDDTPAPNVVSA